MPASLTSDGRIWKFCRYCGTAIWRFPSGQIWRNSNMDESCASSMCGIHVPEYG